MSEYQALKARAMELQREKEEAVKRELAVKQARDRQLARAEEERRARLEAASKEARRRELMRAHEELNRKANTGGAGQKGFQAEYDPFAEDVRPKSQPKPVKVPTKGAASKAIAAKMSSSSSIDAKPSSSLSQTHTSRPGGATSKPKGSAATQAEGRKEKAARLFAQKAKKSGADSLFSVRALVESRDSPPYAFVPRAGPSKQQSVPIPASKAAPPFSKGGSTGSKLGGNKSNGSVKSRFDSGKEELRKLCPDRDTRDRRSIDQISRDLKAKRLGTDTLPPTGTKSSSMTSVPGKQAKPLIPRDKRATATDASRKRQRQPSSSISTDDDDSQSDSYSSPRRRRRHQSPPGRVMKEPSRSDISAEIQALFRRPGRAPQRYDEDVYSDASSDMEAGLGDVEMEERKAARLARLEDEAAEKEERERKARKEAQKRERMRAARG